MKKLLLLSLLQSILISCSNDNDIIPDGTSGDIHGSWQLKAVYVSGVRQSLSECRLYEGVAFEDNSIIMVKTEEKVSAPCTITTVEGTFQRTDNTLSITFPNENKKSKIKELTSVKLVLISENAAETLEYEKATPL
ncbi:lipocalin family protein [Flavobacterium sp. ACN6]|uniref:lipocalin family protein n=1 Tax=Flavobacterium sp. ACN6 TaxID=1920426 RepID=UPI000BB2EDD3|nr:lipocalin family protein [Flavobacterium sp. ACN6]PBJ10182.1 hypothetical protein BSF42_32510 [Flavobacterium sp. ACN6]